jgi:hypothetical protein
MLQNRILMTLFAMYHSVLIDKVVIVVVSIDFISSLIQSFIFEPTPLSDFFQIPSTTVFIRKYFLKIALQNLPNSHGWIKISTLKKSCFYIILVIMLQTVKIYSCYYFSPMFLIT